jgi:hypothetical protein
MATRKMLALAVALGCLAVAFVAGSGSVATAAQGDPILNGVDNLETNGTTFCNVSGGGCGVNGSIGIYSATDKSHGAGVEGYSSGSSGFGAEGISSGAGGTGVLGVGASYGVHGEIYSGTGGWGVWGEGGDRGVYGISANEGVVGFGTNVGVRADSPNIALRVTGKVELSRSGVATIAGTSATPKASVVVSGVALSAKSMVIVTVQKNVTGVWVRAAVPNVAGSSVTIYLNKAVTTSVPVAWMVIERP